MADLGYVRALLFWLGLAGLLAIGRIWPAESPFEAISLWWVACVAGASGSVVGCVLGHVGQDRPGASRWRIRAWVLTAASVALVRGLTSGPEFAAVITTRHRGLAARWQTFVVEGASWPGSRCRVRARGASGQSVRLLLAPELCPLASGDGLLILSRDLVPRLDPVLNRGGPQFSPRHAWVVGRGEGVAHSLAQLRQVAWQASRGADGRAFVVASTLGLSGALPPQRRNQLRRAGLGHLIAISGLHVGLAALFVFRGLLRVLGHLAHGVRVATLLSWVPVVAYVWATGAGPPAVRAAVMLAVCSVGGLLGRPTHGLTVLALACTMMLVANPGWVTQPGFQLSVAAMAVLVRTDSDAGVLRISWQLSWALAPLAWFHFGRAEGYGVLSNMVAIPVFSLWVLPTSLLAAAAIVVGVEPAVALDIPGAGAELLIELAARVAGWPSVPRWVWLVAAGVFLVVRLVRPVAWVRRWAPSRLACLAILVMAGVPGRMGPAESDFEWAAMGSARHASVVIASPHRGGPVCVVEPAGAPQRWPARLDAMGLPVPVAVADLASGRPHLLALRDVLVGLERFSSDPASCAERPEAALVSAALRRCNRIVGGRSWVRASRSGRLECRVPSGWVTLEHGLVTK